MDVARSAPQEAHCHTDLMVLQVRPTPNQFPISILYTLVDNTRLHSIPSVCHPWDFVFLCMYISIIDNLQHLVSVQNRKKVGIPCIKGVTVVCRLPYRRLSIEQVGRVSGKTYLIRLTKANFPRFMTRGTHMTKLPRRDQNASRCPAMIRDLNLPYNYMKIN